MIRRLQIAILAVVLVIAAFSTGAPFLFFLLYLAIVVTGGAYVMTRFGLADLEAGYLLDRQHAHVGDQLAVTYTIRNTSRLPKPWLEVYSPTDLPLPLPGRALVLGPRAERSWVARVPLTRRGQFRIEQLVVRTGDPFGFFESTAGVGEPQTVTVYPPVEPLPGWKLPPAMLEGAQANPERTAQTTPHVTSIRQYVPGDAYNRIHWRSSARHGDLQVKEFDLEQTADVWVFLDLQAGIHAGDGDESTLEYAVRAAAAMSSRALLEGRALGMHAIGRNAAVLPVDRGARQYQKVMQLLAAVQADGSTPLYEVLVRGLPRMRRGMTAVILTPSLAVDWIQPLSKLRVRGVGTLIVLPDATAFGQQEARDKGLPPLEPAEREAREREQRALLHALAEHDLTAARLVPGVPLAEQLVTTAGRRELVHR
jgi:uncharacterized protein (DUF58 family)